MLLTYAVQRSDSVTCIYIYIYFFIFLSVMVYHRILTIVPSVTQKDPVAYLFYIQ